MANLQLKSLSKIYPSGALALYKANIQLSDGEFVAVVGGEKSGKSTLLRLVAGLEEATEGDIYVGEKNVTNVISRDRDLAMIFQGSTLYPSLNVYENMAYGLRARKASNTVVEQRVKAAAEILGLTDVLYRKPKVLTAEQKQRVAFGRAIAREPKIYLLDDPISGVSSDVREKLRSVLINLQMRMSGTFLYASKNVNEALTMATRMIILRDGFVQQIDTPANIYEYPANAYAAFTVGSPTVNFINNAEIVRDGEELFITASDVKLPVPKNISDRFTSLAEYVNTGRKIIAGVRPEDITVGENGFAKAKVSAVEEICGVNYAECEVGKLTLVVTADANTVKGGEVALCADLAHMFIFDAESRLTLLERDGGYQKTEYADADFKPLGYDKEEELKKKFSLPKKDPKKKK